MDSKIYSGAAKNLKPHKFIQPFIPNIIIFILFILFSHWQSSKIVIKIFRLPILHLIL